MGLFSPRAPSKHEPDTASFGVFPPAGAKGGSPIVPSKTALLCIEFQNEFATEGGKMHDAVKSVMEENGMLEKAVETADAVRCAGGKVFHIAIVFKEDSSDNPNKALGILKGCHDGKLFVEGTWNAAFCDAMAPKEGDVEVKGKRGLDAFPNTTLEEELITHGIETVAICGFLTNCCVESTMRTACEKGFNVVTLPDCSATLSADGQKAAAEIAFPMFSTPMTAKEFQAKLAPMSSAVEGSVEVYGIPAHAMGVGFGALLSDLSCGKVVAVDLMKGEHKTPEMLKINPFGTVPSLKDAGFGLGEQNAMWRYIAAKYGPEMYGGDDVQAKATIDFALDWMGGVYGALNVFWYATVGFGPKLPEAEDEREKARVTAHAHLEKFTDVFLASSAFVGGNKPSIADYRFCSMLLVLDHAAVKAVTGFGPCDKATKIRGYLDGFLSASKSAEEHLIVARSFLDPKLP